MQENLVKKIEFFVDERISQISKAKLTAAFPENIRTGSGEKKIFARLKSVSETAVTGKILAINSRQAVYHKFRTAIASYKLFFSTRNE